MSDALASAVQEAAARPEAIAAVDALYGRVEAEIDRRRPICVISGRCCRFEEYGHRLFVTTLEMAHFTHLLGERDVSQWDGKGCPYQQNKLCSVHKARPFGCRMFFCDATSTDWQNQMYEQFHGELRRLHDQLAIPYFYMEWRQALRAIGLCE